MKSIQEEELLLKEESEKLRIKEQKLEDSKQAIAIKTQQLNEKKTVKQQKKSLEEREKELKTRITTILLLKNEFPNFPNFNSVVDTYAERVQEYKNQSINLSIEEKNALLNTMNMGRQYKDSLQVFMSYISFPMVIIDYTIKIQKLEKRVRKLEGK